MQTINWQQFGLKRNPYDAHPLIEGGEFQIEEAFVGRKQELQFLNSLFESENHLCLTILGDVGVGKTSLANFHKSLWKSKKDKPLFSFRREIEANDALLDKRNFLIEIIASVIREISLLDPDRLKDELLKQLSRIVDLSQSMAISGGINVLGFGADIGVNKTPAQPVQMATATLEAHFNSLVAYIKNTEILKKKHAGLIIHVNNFDVVLADSSGKKKAIQFFNEIRDTLQIPDTYFIFIGPRNFFKDVISAQGRVKSIFYQTPLFLDPLSKNEIVRAFDERMRLLKSNDVSHFIKPVQDDVVFRLYDLYKGDIRSIMAAIREILGQQSERIMRPLNADDAMLLLGQGRWEKIEQSLTDEQKIILRLLVEADKPVSQKSISQRLGKAQANISGYYFKPLRDKDIIEEKEKIGNTKYWGLTENYLPLKWWFESQKKIQKKISDDSTQLALF